MIRIFLFLILFQFSFSRARATGEYIVALVNGGETVYLEVNPCVGQVYKVKINFNAGNGGISYVSWYVNGQLAKTVQNDSIVNLPATTNTMNITCTVHYVNGSSGTTAAALPVTVNSVILGQITASSTSANLGCSLPISLTTGIAGGYSPPPDETSYTWSLPGTWSIASGAGSNSVTVTPDATSSGNILATLVINACGYKSNSSTVAMSRTASNAQEFLYTNPVVLCDNSTSSFSVLGACGASSYTWTVSGNTVAKFQASGTQSVTTSTASAAITTGLLAGASTNLSVVANYPGGTSSSAISETILSGAPNASLLNIVSQGPPWCANVPISFGVNYNGSCTNFQSEGITNVTWWVAPTPTQIINNAGLAHCTIGTNSGVEIKFSRSSTMYNVRASATNACGTSGLNTALFVTLGQAGITCPIGDAADADSATADAARGIFGSASASGFSIAPNPSTGQVLVTLPSKADDLEKTPSLIRQIDVYNVAGVRVKTFSFGAGVAGSTSVDLGNSANGIYILVITTDKARYNEKIAVAR
jgi:hypothetical protein